MGPGLAESLSWMLEGGSGERDVLICGVDTESTQRTVHLLQLCVGDRAVLIHRSSGLLTCRGDLASFLNGSAAIPGRPPVVFCGAELVGDAAALLADGLVMHRGLDATPLYSALYGGGRASDAERGDGSPTRKPLPQAAWDENAIVGLRRMFETTYGVVWAKDKAVTISDWSVRDLSPLQVEYAAQVRSGSV